MAQCMALTGSAVKGINLFGCSPNLRMYSSCSDQVGACTNDSVYMDRVTSSSDRSHYPSLLTNGRYYGDEYTRMKWSPDAVGSQCRMHFNHFLQPSCSCSWSTSRSLVVIAVLSSIVLIHHHHHHRFLLPVLVFSCSYSCSCSCSCSCSSSSSSSASTFLLLLFVCLSYYCSS